MKAGRRSRVRHDIARGAAAGLVVLALLVVLVPAAAADDGAVPAVTGRVVPVRAGTAPLPAAAAATEADTTVAADTVVVVDPGREFELVGALLRGVDPVHSGLVVTVSGSADGLSWDAPLPLDFVGAYAARGSVQCVSDVVSEPVWLGRARYVRVTVSGPSPARRVALRALRLACVTALPVDGPPGPLPDVSREPAAASGPDSLSSVPKPEIVTRRQWGANESWRSGRLSYGRVRVIFVHHTVTSNTYTQAEAPAIVRAVYYYHARVEGFNDIGYNFLIDRYGKIYEGRYGGMTKAVVGAQTLGFNSWSSGVSMIGTFTSAKPTAAMVQSLERLVAWKLDVHHLNPLGTSTIRNSTAEKYPAGAWVRLPVVAGHRQANYTTCPGNGVFSRLDDVRRAADAMGNPKIFRPRISPSVFSPNDDGYRDHATAAGGLSRSADWKVEVCDDMDTVVRRLSGSGSSIAAVWNGKNGDGEVVPDGRYHCVLSAHNASGDARPATVSVRVDTGAPTPVAGPAASPSTISPNGDGFADAAAIRFRPSERCQARVSVFAADGTMVHRLKDWYALGAVSTVVPWNGRVDGAAGPIAAPEGSYRVRVELKDVAGNRSSTSVPVKVDDTLGFAQAVPHDISPNGDGVKEATDLTFRLTRTARVTVVIKRGDTTVRTFRPGELAAGDRQVHWNGTNGDGAKVADGRYAFAVNADSVMGVVTVRGTVRVDRYRPRPTSSVSSIGVALGRRVTVPYTVRDPYSPTVHVVVVVQDLAGGEVRRADLGWVTSGHAHKWYYTPTARGSYAIVVRATDHAGNDQLAPARIALTVR
jgi:flagellar hook assembly protein FlgD